MEELLLKKSLGKGLGSLIRSNDTNYINKEEQVKKSEAFLTDISPNKEQPRKSFSQEPLDDLAESVRLTASFSQLP